jgi:hypothetical protein
MKTRALLFLLLLTSCSSGADLAPVVQAQSAPSSSSRDWYSGGMPTPDASPLEHALHGGISVPPDRGLAMIEAHVEAGDREGAVQRIRRVARSLAAISSQRDGCTIEAWSFDAVQRGDDTYHASATLRLDVELTGARALSERQDRVEACLGALDTLDPSRFEGVVVRRSELVLTLDDPSQHRGALLERRMAALHAVALQNEVAPQFRSDALRCTSSGEVTIQARSLRGIDLAIDFTCAPARPGEPAHPATVATNVDY